MRKLVLPALVVLWAAGCAPRSVLPTPAPPSQLDAARARAHREQGSRLLMQQGKVAEAAAAFGRALRLAPADAVARQWAAWTSAMQADQQAAFEHLLWLSRSRTPAAELAIWTAYRLVVTRGQAINLAVVLQSVVDDRRSPPGVRSRARHFLGHTLRSLGRFAEAREMFRGLGYLRDWMVVGPFENDQNAGFDEVFPPEEGFDHYKDTYPGKLRPIGWRRVDHYDYDGRVNLAALLDPSRWSCAYLTTFVHSDREREAALRLGAFRGVKLWLNGRLLLADDDAHLAALDQYVVGARLEKGWNRLLVKVCQRSGPWQLRLRITDPAGEPIEGLRADVAIRPTPDRSGATTALPVPSSLERRLADDDGDDCGLRALQQAIWTRRNGFYRQAVEQAVALAEAWPRSPLAQMMLARAHFAADHESSALQAIRQALRRAPGLPDALCQRARYEQRHGRYDRALEILAPLRAGTSSDSVPLSVRTLYASLLADRGWTLDALRAVQRLLGRHPDHAGLLRRAGSLHLQLDQHDAARAAYRRALSARANHTGTYDRLIEMARERGETQTALRHIRQKSRAFPCLITSALREAEILLADGAYRQAIEMCDRVEAIAPQYWYVQKLRGDIHNRCGDRKAALRGYRASLARHPNNPGLRDYIDFLVQRRDQAFERYGLGEHEIEDILLKRPDPAAYPEADAVFLLDDEVTHVFQDGSAAHLVHQIYLVRTEKGQRRLNELRVPSGASFRLDAAETIKPDGTRQEATSIRRGVIHFPALEPGSLLHVAYRYKSSSSSWMEDHFAMHFNFQGSIPWKRGRWVLVMPADKELKVLRRGDFIRERSETHEGEKVFIWTAVDVPMLHSEALRPPARLLQGAVYVSTVPSWEALARWQNSLISDQFDLDAAIRVKTRDLTRDAKTPLDKLAAIYAFVAREVRYLNNDVGIFGKKPNKAVNIFDNRYGDCKDKATLMIAMLKEVGIQAAYAGVRTVDRGPVFWEVPYAQTNHIITYVPAQPGIDEPLFVDGTSRFGHLHFLPARDQGIKALVLDGKSHQIIETPVLPPEASTLRTRLQAEVEGDSLWVTGREQWTGWFAKTHRSRYNVEGKRAEELARELGYRFPGAVLEQASFAGLDTLEPEASATYRFSIPGRVRREADTLRVNLLWPSNLGRAMARKPERHYDLFLVHRTNYELASTLRIPPGHEVRTLPAPLHLDNDLLRFDQDCTRQDDTVSCSRRLTLKALTYPVVRYQQFRQMCGQIDQAEAQDIVLERAGGQSTRQGR